MDLGGEDGLGGVTLHLGSGRAFRLLRPDTMISTEEDVDLDVVNTPSYPEAGRGWMPPTAAVGERGAVGVVAGVDDGEQGFSIGGGSVTMERKFAGGATRAGIQGVRSRRV